MSNDKFLDMLRNTVCYLKLFFFKSGTAFSKFYKIWLNLTFISKYLSIFVTLGSAPYSIEEKKEKKRLEIKPKCIDHIETVQGNH